MTSLDDTSAPRHGPRFGLRSLFVALTLLAVLAAGYGWFNRRILEPSRQTRAIEQHLESLAARRPKDMSPRQWESAVAWTLNLHGNSLIRFQADADELGAFERRLAAKLTNDVNMDTIHWIWDEYAKVCPGGEKYQRFKGMMMEEIEAGGGNWGIKVR